MIGQTGWKKDPEEVKKVLSRLPNPLFEYSAKNLKGTGEGKTVLLYEAVKKVMGNHMPAQNQPRGTCVSRGYSRGVDYLECVQIAIGNKSEELKLISHSAVYGMSREIGNWMSYEDGSVGAWAAEAVNKWGCATNEECNDRDAGYDDLAVEWAAKGVPQKIKDLAKDNLVKTVSLVKTPEEARDAICNGYPVPVCSGQGFSMERDSEGYCRAQGSWSHCMVWTGYDDNKKRFLVEQSWGQNTPSGPLYLDQPDNSFWIDWNTAARMLREEDSFALSNFDGFPAQQLSWYI